MVSDGLSVLNADILQHLVPHVPGGIGERNFLGNSIA